MTKKRWNDRAFWVVRDAFTDDGDVSFPVTSRGKTVHDYDEEDRPYPRTTELRYNVWVQLTRVRLKPQERARVRVTAQECKRGKWELRRDKHEPSAIRVYAAGAPSWGLEEASFCDFHLENYIGLEVPEGDKVAVRVRFVVEILRRARRMKR